MENDNNSNYYSKYLKYKNKYLDLKNILLKQNGRGKVINCVLVAHNGRIKCLLTSLGVPIKKMIEGKGDKKFEMRFKNCAIILLKVSSNRIEISLVYDGEINILKKDYYYYVNGETNLNKSEIKFETFNLEGNSYIQGLRTLKLKPEDIEDNIINFYMVRHGEGEHNVASKSEKIFSNKILDASLTQYGIQQAINASAYLKNIEFNYCFVSDLRRTRETIQNLLSNNEYLNQITKIYVAPCAHELDFVSSGNCDGSQMFSALERENQMKCEPQTDTCSIDDSQVCCLIKVPNQNTVKSIPLEWSFYRQFYSGGSRKSPGKSRLHCRDTNMISMSFYIIKFNQSTNLTNMTNWVDSRK